MPELTRRYIVMPMATEGPFDTTDPDGAFVLKPWKDPAALRALETYRESCYPALAQELDVWIKAIRQGPVVRGGVGARNELYAARAAAPASAAASKPGGGASGKARGAARRKARPGAKAASHARASKAAKKKPKRR